jgi:hypothetical protein
MPLKMNVWLMSKTSITLVIFGDMILKKLSIISFKRKKKKLIILLKKWPKMIYLRLKML